MTTVVEVLDTTTLEPVVEGEIGELVITTLTKEAFQVIRYRTRDLACLFPGTCPCGRPDALKRLLLSLITLFAFGGESLQEFRCAPAWD